MFLVAIEALATKNKLIIAGEISANAKINFEEIARKRIRDLGYTNPKFNFTDKCDIETYIQKQSNEIAEGVDKKGAGDQGMMFGYACRETESLMPLPIIIAHTLAEKIDQARQNELDYLRPDGKTQVTIEYKNGKPSRVLQTVIAVPHDEKVKLAKVKKDIFETVVTPALKEFGFKINLKDLILNGTGIWHIGGPASDTGLTGHIVTGKQIGRAHV